MPQTTGKHLLAEPDFSPSLAAFKDNFRINGKNAIQNTRQHFDYSKLDAWISTFPIDSERGQVHMLTCFYGLEEENMRYGFAVVPGTPLGNGQFSYTTPSHPSHILMSNGDLNAVTPSAWQAFQDAYFWNVQVSRAGNGSFEPLKPPTDPSSRDAKCVTVAYETEIEQMYTTTIQGRNVRDCRLTIDSLSIDIDKRTNVVDYKHQVGYFLIDIVKDEVYVGVADPSSPYHDVAIEFSTACPPEC